MRNETLFELPSEACIASRSRDVTRLLEHSVIGWKVDRLLVVTYNGLSS